MKAETLGLISVVMCVCYLGVGVYVGLFIPTDDGLATARIDAEDSLSREFTIERSHDEVYYQVEVLSGPWIDVYIFTEADYQRYLSGQLPIGNDSLILENRRYVHRSAYMPGGTYWFVIDNSDYGTPNLQSEDVVVEYTLSSAPPARTSLHSFTLWLFMAFILFLVGVLLVVMSKRIDRYRQFG
ncbi:MAG: hypothetical protein LN416_09585 [Candidatus Thermoplasmatota archaeon]|nr:hypothetical protein [Candidatus Thermoplasmatota archaeon]